MSTLGLVVEKKKDQRPLDFPTLHELEFIFDVPCDFNARSMEGNLREVDRCGALYHPRENRRVVEEVPAGLWRNPRSPKFRGEHRFEPS